MGQPPVSAPRRWELTDVVTASFQLSRRRWKTLVQISLVPTVFAGLAFALIAAVVAVVVLVVGFPHLSPPTGALFVSLGFSVTICLMGLVYMALQVKAMVAGVQVTLADHAGQHVAFRQAWRGSTGVLRKVIGPILAVVAFYVLTSAAIGVIGVAFGLIAGTTGTHTVGIVLTVLVIYALMAVSVLGVYYVLARCIFLPAVFATEPRLRFVAAFKRAWHYTRGRFWRTFGYLVVLNLMSAVPMAAIQLFQGLVLVPANSWVSPDNPQPLSLQVAMLTLVSMLLVWALGCVVTAFQIAYLGIMFVARRDEGDLGLPAEAPHTVSS